MPRGISAARAACPASAASLPPDQSGGIGTRRSTWDEHACETAFHIDGTCAELRTRRRAGRRPGQRTETQWQRELDEQPGYGTNDWYGADDNGWDG